MKNLVSILLLTFLISSCKGQTETKPSLQSISPRDFAQKLEKVGNPQLIDVRTPQEFEGQHLDGAENIDWNGGTFEKQVSKFDKNKPVFVYCMVGGRSRKAAEKLAESGFAEVYDMQGGIVKWNSEGLSKPVSGGMSKKDFEKSIAGPKVLASFYAEWCGPCRQMSPYMEKLSSDPSLNVKVLRIDADKNKSLMQELKVSELPTLLLYKDGKLVWTHEGFISESNLKNELR